MTINVRRATPADVADIAGLALEIQDVHVAGRPDLFKPGGVESIDQIAHRVGADGQFYWVATLGDTPVGYAYARLVDEPESRWRYATRLLMLDQMGVAKGHRSRGVGEALWNAVLGTAAEERAERVVLNVWAFNRDARRFYERLGFRAFHERLAFELGQSDRGAR
jgi:ribosomal protein S18 acetylase RimI-like enzyme